MFGEIRPDKPTMIRVNTHRGVYDTLSEVRGHQRWSVDTALERISQEGSGVLVLLEYSEDWGALDRRLQGGGEAEPGHGELRMIGAGSQILSDLHVERVRVLGTPQRIHALSGFGLEVVDYIEAPDSN